MPDTTSNPNTTKSTKSKPKLKSDFALQGTRA